MEPQNSTQLSCKLAALLLITGLAIIHPVKVEASSSMKRLYDELFTDYNRLILPVASNGSKVFVTMGLKLGQILDLNLKLQILSSNVWLEQTWQDYRLQWQPEYYNNIDMIHVPAENIWIPDIVLFNNADGNYELTLVAKAKIYSNGTVVWKPPSMFRSTCEIDVEYFPFDIQTCFLRFASWTYAGDEVELRHASTNLSKADIGIDLSQFYKNVEWDIIDVPAYYNKNYYLQHTEYYPDITFKIVIRRKILFYFVNLIIPVAMMTFMTVSVFYLPSDSNEKVTLSISILTSLIVFFLLMLEIIPASSLAVPLFGKYLLFTMILVCLSVCVSVYVLNLHHRSPSIHVMTPKVRRIFLETLPRLLNINRPDPEERGSLNRFRKKKIAQKLLNQSAQRLYDVAQPLAASLNLIETLHKSYQLSGTESKEERDHLKKIDNIEEDERRYFRCYVDNYISNLKKKDEEKAKQKPELQQGTKLLGCCEQSRCCSQANQPLASLQRQPNSQPNDGFRFVRGQETPKDWSGNRVEPNYIMAPARSTPNRQWSQVSNTGCRQCSLHQNQLICHHQSSDLVHDDTLDMTFDYDCDHMQQQAAQLQQQHQLGSCLPMMEGPEELLSPPPPPRQLTQLSDSLDGRISACGNQAKGSANDNQQLVNQLISSIHLINTASEDLTSTTSTNSNSAEIQARSAQLSHLHSYASHHQQEHQSKQLTNSQIHPGAPQMRPISPAQASNAMGGEIGHSKLRQCSSGEVLDADPSGLLLGKPSDLLLSLRLSYEQMPAHVRAAIRSILFIADAIKNEDDDTSAMEDWQSVSMVIDRLFLWIFFMICTFGTIIVLGLAPSLYDQRPPIDDLLRIELPQNNCSAS